QLHDNDWFVRHSRRLLAERAAAGKLNKASHAELEQIAFTSPYQAKRLRGLWALHVTGGVTPPPTPKGPGGRRAPAPPRGAPRAWTIQLALEGGASRDLLRKLTSLAKEDPSPVVRLYLASAAQRLPLADRWELLGNLLAHAEDAADHNLPLMYWYAAEPLAG